MPTGLPFPCLHLICNVDVPEASFPPVDVDTQILAIKGRPGISNVNVYTPILEGGRIRGGPLFNNTEKYV